MKRLISLDVFRGITITLMILVNSPGNFTPYAFLEHSEWNGCALADLVFPFFIVIVGISSVLALSNLSAKGISSYQLFKKSLRRSVYIFLMGLFLNAFPYHFDFDSIRIMGVLQRIAVCYFCSSVLFLTSNVRTQLIICGGLLISYAALLTLYAPIPNLDPLSLEGNLVGYWDRLVLSSNHLYTPGFDPEGLLSTLPSIATVIIGNLLGYYVIRCKTDGESKKPLKGIIFFGLVLTAIGWLWHFTLPFNKALWSSSYVFWTSGLAFLIFAVVYWLIEIRQYKQWALPFDLFGRHAMMVYMLHVLFLKIQAAIHVPNSAGQLINLRLYFTELFFGRFPTEIASLCYSMSYILLWLFVIIIVEYKKNRVTHLVKTQEG